MNDYISKNGLLYTQDLHTVVGIDSSSQDFTGRVPYGAQSIADDVFSNCSYENISLPDSIKELPPCLFENSESLQSVKLPSSLQVIPPYLFSGCRGLTKVTLPATVTAFSEGLFYNCSRIQEIPFKAGIQELPENVCAGCSALKSVVIPNTVAEIKTHAFADCTSLETVVLPAKMYELAEDAFEGCISLKNIRIDPSNNLFYVNENDGCLYEKSIEGEDKCRLRVSGVSKPDVKFFADKIDETNTDDIYLPDEDDAEEDDSFSAEIGAGSDELTSMGVKEQEIQENNKQIVNETRDTSEENMAEDNVDSMLADIMGEEKQRNEAASDAVGVSDKESEVLSEMMDVMSDSKKESNGAAVSEAELANLFASSEKNESGAGKDEASDRGNGAAMDSKTKILLDSAEFKKVMDFNPKGEAPVDSDLFVIAEKTVTNAEGAEDFSEKLISCCKAFARIHDFKRVIMLKGLPVDNDEFMQFFFHFMTKKNLVLACEAARPSELSDYCKTICEQSRISLEKDELTEQRKRISIKTDMLIKLVIQDKYN